MVPSLRPHPGGCVTRALPPTESFRRLARPPCNFVERRRNTESATWQQGETPWLAASRSAWRRIYERASYHDYVHARRNFSRAMSSTPLASPCVSPTPTESAHYVFFFSLSFFEKDNDHGEIFGTGTLSIKRCETRFQREQKYVSREKKKEKKEKINTKQKRIKGNG